MAFKQLPGNQGMIYVPDSKPDKKKHPCPDCFFCQWCGNERCRTCRANICCKKNGGTLQRIPMRTVLCRTAPQGLSPRNNHMSA
ncbi:MAG: hypothetical protein MUO63_22210 [Desulfobulbaceae bacterium]|nr:hypothetical protein [Desulfobulbaceae bacterium]